MKQAMDKIDAAIGFLEARACVVGDVATDPAAEAMAEVLRSARAEIDRAAFGHPPEFLAEREADDALGLDECWWDKVHEGLALRGETTRTKTVFWCAVRYVDGTGSWWATAAISGALVFASEHAEMREAMNECVRAVERAWEIRGPKPAKIRGAF